MTPQTAELFRAASTIHPRRAESQRVSVALFCGGRGSSTIIRELLRWPHIHLSLLVNAYDDGLSTGELRELVPNMLGPSDFRKNLSGLLDLHSREQYALQTLLELRLPKSFSDADVAAFRRYTEGRGTAAGLPQPLGEAFGALSAPLRREIVAHIARFFAHQDAHPGALRFADCSVGNLVFVGAYLRSGHDFNAAVRELAIMCGSAADLVNVTLGENRTLAALKDNGEILAREADIVGPQSDARIVEMAFLERPLRPEELADLDALPFADKRRRLRELDRPVRLSPEAEYAIAHADLIVYGPGTQHSSLLPSYRTQGIADAIARSRAGARVFVSNLDRDHDIQSCTAVDLVDAALDLLGDPLNRRRLITHILYNSASGQRSTGLQPALPASASTYKGARFDWGDWESSATPGKHSGFAVTRHLARLHEEAQRDEALESIEVYADLVSRTGFSDALIQEFVELPWSKEFQSAALKINHLESSPLSAPPPDVNVERVDYEGPFSDVEALVNWLLQSDSEYLVTLSGDGEYRLSDIFLGVQVLRAGNFGVLHGSRTQCRSQFRSSLRAAYGDHPVLHGLSWLAGFLVAAAFGVMSRVILADPLTGFRIYRRSRLHGTFAEALARRGTLAATTVTRMLVQRQIEVAEIPVYYRTFRGFTEPWWRIRRGLQNLWGVIR